MIKSLNIHNFQCHSTLRIDLDPKITTIVGSSDVGKSAIIRAKRWLAQNKPDGDGFIKNGSEEVEVTLEFDDHKITRSKGKENLYTLNGQEYRAFGRGNVPEDIEKVLNVSDLNFQNQLDGPFWLSLTAGEVSRRLNDIVDLGIIDKSLTAVAKKIRRSKDRVQICRERLIDAKHRKSELEWTVAANEQYKVLESKSKTLKQLADKRYDLGEITDQCQGLQNTVTTTTAKHTVAAAACKAARAYRQALTQRETLSQLIDDANNLSSKTEPPDISELDRAAEEYSRHADKVSLLSGLVKKVHEALGHVHRLSTLTKLMEEELHEELEGRCPICGKEME